MSVRIAIIVEGETERVFMPKLREFLKAHISVMPEIDALPCDGRIPTSNKLKRQVTNLLSGRNPADAVIALTDVYTGTQEFQNAQEAKNKMRGWVGNEPRFYPHVALHDFEAWLLPYWSTIQKLAGSNRASLSTHPENVNHGKPPAYWLKEIFRTGSKGKHYVKPRDAGRILRDNNLLIAAQSCPELESLLTTILLLCGLKKEEVDKIFHPNDGKKRG